MNRHIFSAEFIYHANICNLYDFKVSRRKRVLYRWKREFLKLYAKHVGYDYQSWNSFWCDECYSKVNDKDIARCSGKSCGGYIAGKHEHILMRYELPYITEEPCLFPYIPKIAIYHLPTSEYRYSGPVHSMQSANFVSFFHICEERIGLKIDKTTTADVDPFESLKWLITYCQKHQLIPKRQKTARELPF